MKKFFLSCLILLSFNFNFAMQEKSCGTLMCKDSTFSLTQEYQNKIHKYQWLLREIRKNKETLYDLDEQLNKILCDETLDNNFKNNEKIKIVILSNELLNKNIKLSILLDNLLKEVQSNG